MENNKKKKMILLILVLAIMMIALGGATFAYFSASGGSSNDAITANATLLPDIDVTSSNSKISYDLIPVHSESPYFYRYPGTASSGEHSCLDDLGNEICTVYEFTIINSAPVAQTIYVNFEPTENTFDNLYFAAFNTTAASADYTVATGSSGSGNNFTLTAQTAASNSTLGHPATKLTKNSTTPINMPGLSTNIPAGESVTYTVLVWLQDTNSNQNTEQGGQFKAGINVTSASSPNGVTGILDSTTSGSSVSSANIVYTNDGNIIGTHGSQLDEEELSYTFPTAASAMNGNPLPITMKAVLSDNNEVEEIYVVFEVTSDMVSNNPGMVAGTYEIGKKCDSYYGCGMCWSEEESDYVPCADPLLEDAISAIKTAFGYTSHPERCEVYESDEIYKTIQCSIDTLSVYYEGSGDIMSAGKDGTWGCGRSDSGLSYCGSYY